MSDWQPIETAPKDGTRILVINAAGHHTLTYWYRPIGEDGLPARSGHWIWTANDPTHWMPLPEAPR